MEDEEKNKNLLEAFKCRSSKMFVEWLEHGADPEQVVDNDTNLSTFELLCKSPDASEYIQKCLDHKTDPNRINPHNHRYPIHTAVENLAVQNIKILLEADAECANQTINFDKTPLHLIAEVVNDANLPTVFEMIQIFAEFGGDFGWPARKSENQTPFQLLLEKFATLQNKALCSLIISFLTRRNPKIGMFQKERCLNLMLDHFPDSTDEHDVITNCEEYIEIVSDWPSALFKSLEENEAVFLRMFDSQKESRKKELTPFALELVSRAIEFGRFDSFAEIYETCELDTTYVAETILYFNRFRILKYFLNHANVTRIPPQWMHKVLKKIRDKEHDIDLDIKKCFHTLLNHPKYNVNEPIPIRGNETVLHFAATVSEYAVVELLKSGASLTSRNKRGKMAIECIANNALKMFLDTCVTTCIPAKRTEIDYYMVFDYTFLKASREDSSKHILKKEMEPIDYLAKSNDLGSLIEHPVISSFLFMRWLRLSTIFYMNLLIFSINMLFCSSYLSFYYASGHYQDSSSINHTLWSIATLNNSLLFLKEIFQFIGSPKRYVKSFENYFEIGLISLMGAALFVPIKDQQARRAIATVLFLGFAIEWTLMFSALPLFSGSNYIVMLKKVAVNFLRTLAFYSIILLAFVQSFYTLVNEHEENSQNGTMDGSNRTGEAEPDASRHSSVFSVIYHVVLMMTGDFGVLADDLQAMIMGRVVLLIFVFSMTIVMTNLLVGLTVSDTAAIQLEAERYKWLERAELLTKYESLAWNVEQKLCVRWLKDLGMSKMVLMPDFLPLNKIKVEISSFDSNKWIFIPTRNPINSFSNDIEGHPLPLIDFKTEALHRSFLGCNRVPVEMNAWIIEKGLQVLECNREMKLKMSTANSSKQTRRTEIEKIQRQYVTIEHKLDKLLRQRRGTPSIAGSAYFLFETPAQRTLNV